MTTDFGKSWKRIIGDLPAKAAWVHVVREDPRNRNLLYIGTEMGAWASWNRGAHWASLRGDLPAVPVRDIQIHSRDNDILLATHGRGLYILDDATALQQLDDAMKSDVTLFDVRPAVRWSLWSQDGNLGQKRWAGDNPPAGALISYFLKTQPVGEVDVTITDAQGRTVRRIRRVSDEPGVNRVAWDLRYDSPAQGGGGPGGRAGAGAATAGAATAEADTSLVALRARRRAQAAGDAAVAGAAGAAGDFGGGFGGGGLSVLPGTYTVTLSADGKSYTKSLQVENDSRSDMTPAQLSAQFEAATQSRDLTNRFNRILATADDMTRQLMSLQDQLRRPQRGGAPIAPAGDSAGGPGNAPGVPRAASPVLGEIDAALAELKQLRDSVLARPLPGLGYRQYPRLREEIQTLSGMVSRPLMPPTAGELLRIGELKTETDQAQARVDAIIRDRVVRINQMLSGTPHVITPGRPPGG